MSDLAEHVAMAYLHKVAAIRENRQPDWPPELDDVDPLALLTQATAELDSVFAARDPAGPAWTWGPEQTVAFWIRRMAHETAVHRVDAEAAAGERTPVDPGLAVDGADEMLSVLLPTIQRHWGDELRSQLKGARGEVVAVRTGGREWRLELGPDGIGFAPSGPLEATVEGEPEQVLLWLWGRGGEVSIAGSEAAAGLLGIAMRAAAQ
jgi:uncharacterized protein (TIGR03083 family)